MTEPKKPGSKRAPKNRANAISPARKAAYNILLAVERGHSHSDDLLRGKAVSALSEADRNLATALVLGVLRWQILLDRKVQPLLTRPNAKLDSEILIALRLGAFQLLHMDRIPARAAIDESVELAKQAGHRFASAMVNAVLRKLANSTRSASEDLALNAHPAWMVERWINFYGLEAAQAICHHGQCQPALTVRINEPDAFEQAPVEDRGFPPIPQKETEWMGHPSVAEELADAGVVLDPGQLLTAARTVLAGDIAEIEAFREGRVRFQDEGSQLIAELAGWKNDALDQKVRTIGDCCAAPGGKTLILAERNPQARIVACESSEPRLEQLRKRLAHLGEQVEFRLADATTLTDDAAFDLVLADVPCSGTGTLGRNPEIRHRLRLEDLLRQAERQRAILSAALRAVRLGGRVVYSTCSLEPEENEQVVASVLSTTPTARQLSLDARIDELLADGVLTATGAEQLRTSLTPDGALRLLPGSLHSDGFFIALIERTT